MGKKTYVSVSNRLTSYFSKVSGFKNLDIKELNFEIQIF